MAFNIFLVLAAVVLAAAQSSVVSLFLIDINDTPQPLVGSIVSEVSIECDLTTRNQSITCALGKWYHCLQHQLRQDRSYQRLWISSRLDVHRRTYNSSIRVGCSL